MPSARPVPEQAGGRRPPTEQAQQVQRGALARAQREHVRAMGVRAGSRHEVGHAFHAHGVGVEVGQRQLAPGHQRLLPELAQRGLVAQHVHNVRAHPACARAGCMGHIRVGCMSHARKVVLTGQDKKWNKQADEWLCLDSRFEGSIGCTPE